MSIVDSPIEDLVDRDSLLLRVVRVQGSLVSFVFLPKFTHVLIKVSDKGDRGTSVSSVITGRGSKRYLSQSDV